VGSATSAMPAMFHWTIDRSEYKQVMRWSPWEVRATQSGHTFLLLLLAELVLAVLSSSPSSARGRLCALGSVVTYLKSAVLNNLFFFFFFFVYNSFLFLSVTSRRHRCSHRQCTTRQWSLRTTWVPVWIKKKKT